MILWNCENDSSITLEQTEFKVKIDNLSYEQANTDNTFSKLKTKFDIKEPTFNTRKGGYFSKIKETFSKSEKDFSDLDPSIDVNTIKKITLKNYTSYTMRIDEPQNNTNSFANIVIQESNGVQEIFTFRYFPTASKTTSKTESFNGTYTMTKGMCLPDQNGSCDGDSDDDGGSDGGTDFVEICENSFEITSVECQCSHGPGNYCTGCGGPGTYHDIIEATENCYWDYQGSTGTSVVTETSNNTVGGSNTSTGNTTVITSPIKEPLLNYALESIIECLDPDKIQLSWLNNELTDNSLNIISLFNLISISSCSNETTKTIEDFIDIAIEIPDAKFERFEELMELIKDNPFALVEDCIQENGLDIANYQELYNHTLPQSCIDRLSQLGKGFADQPLNTGNSAVANVDYYGVEITTNPDFNLDGNPDTDAEVYQAYKEKFTELASGSKDDFQFSCDVHFDSDDKADISWIFYPYYSQDAIMWNSTSPINTIIRINAWGDVIFSDLVSDDGAIMISAFTPEYWIGSTVQTFITGTQPFSGNRQWGHLTNQSGNLELYARAVDVARVSTITLKGPGTDECKEDTYYNIGEETWSNLQEEIKNWVNAFNGQATVIPKTAIRFDKTKLKELLESNETIDQIDCN